MADWLLAAEKALAETPGLPVLKDRNRAVLSLPVEIQGRKGT